jgi:hypothetical protein
MFAGTDMPFFILPAPLAKHPARLFFLKQPFPGNPFSCGLKKRKYPAERENSLSYTG